MASKKAIYLETLDQIPNKDEALQFIKAYDKAAAPYEEFFADLGAMLYMKDPSSQSQATLLEFSTQVEKMIKKASTSSNTLQSFIRTLKTKYITGPQLQKQIEKFNRNNALRDWSKQSVISPTEDDPHLILTPIYYPLWTQYLDPEKRKWTADQILLLAAEGIHEQLIQDLSLGAQVKPPSEIAETFKNRLEAKFRGYEENSKQ